MDRRTEEDVDRRTHSGYEEKTMRRKEEQEEDDFDAEVVESRRSSYGEEIRCH